MRQAYDYWQDQPGNYCGGRRGERCANPFLARPLGGRSQFHSTPGTRRECARNHAVRVPGPLCLCRVFQLVRPCELGTYRWHTTRGCRECPRATSGKNHKSSASRTLFLAKGHAVQRPSRLASSAPQTTRLQVRPFHVVGEPVGSTWLASLASKCPPVVPGTRYPSRAYSYGPNTALWLLSLFTDACPLNSTGNSLCPGRSSDTLAPDLQTAPRGPRRPRLASHGTGTRSRRVCS